MKPRFSSAVRHLAHGAAVEKIMSLLNGLVLLRFLPLTDYGWLVLIYSACSIVDMLVGLALGELIVARISEANSRGRGKEASGLFTSYVLLMAITGVIVLIAAAVLLHIAGSSRLDIYDLRYYLLAAAVTAPLRSLILTELRIRQDFAKVKATDILRAVVLTTGYVVGIAGLGLGLAGAVTAYVVSNLVPVLLVAPTLVPKVIAAFARPALAPVTQLLIDEGKWQTLRYGVTALHASARPWLIQAVLGPQAVAVFDAAKTATGASLDLLPMKEALVPMMSEEAHRPMRLRALYVDSIRCGIWLFGAMGLCIALVAPLVFTVVFPQYDDAIPVTQVLALAFLTTGFASPQSAVMYALRMQPTYLSTTLLNFTCLFALGIPLMFVWGPAGMAAALVASGVVIAVLRQKAIVRRYPQLRISWKEWLRWSASDWQFVKTLLVRRSGVHEPDEAGLVPADAEGVKAG